MGKQAKRKAVFAPCRFLFGNENGSKSLRAASVDCTMKCAACGWNPEERERRMLTGRMVTENGITKLVFPRYAE